MPTSTRWLFYDLETTGLSPQHDQVLGFAWILTDDQLEPLERREGVVRVRPDVIPTPGAAMVHGLSPKDLQARGVSEADFIAAFQTRLLSQQGAHRVLVSGYNTIAFDDEFIRHTLWRNLLPPYDHEWRGGNARCDVYHMVQLAHAWERGLAFSANADGRPDMRLVAVAQANGIDLSDEAAHDALADVEATVAVARRIRSEAPELFRLATTALTDKKGLKRLLSHANVHGLPVWMTSRKLPGGGSLVYPLCLDPQNLNKYYAVDLNRPCDDLLEADPATIRENVFKRAAERSATDPVMPCVSIECNRMPMVEAFEPDSPAHVARAARFGLDVARCEESLALLADRQSSLSARLIEAHDSSHLPPPADPAYGGLYSGGFVSDVDRQGLEALRGPLFLGGPPRIASADLRAYWPGNADPRLYALSLRHKWIEHGRAALADFPDEGGDFARFLLDRFFGDGPDGIPRLAAFRQEMAEKRIAHANDPRRLQVLNELEEHVMGQARRVRAFAQRCGVGSEPQSAPRAAGGRPSPGQAA